eukprot:1938054-Amphidinium_carterae.1
MGSYSTEYAIVCLGVSARGCAGGYEKGGYDKGYDSKGFSKGGYDKGYDKGGTEWHTCVAVELKGCESDTSLIGSI